MPVKIIECPRDAMQGLHDFIPTQKKIEYARTLAMAGFDTIDIGSFVSPKAIPQMADTPELLTALYDENLTTQLLVIVANKRGIDEAVRFSNVSYLGFPFSVSETFQRRNTNATIEEAFDTVNYLKEKCDEHNKKPVIYISMGFGNPYGDEWNPEIVMRWTEKIIASGIRIISLADTVGVATPETISFLISNLVPKFREVEFGVHLHTTPSTWKEKVDAAYTNGCMRFDGAIKGYGGCPMANDELVGNMPTENLIQYFREKNVELNIDDEAFAKCLLKAEKEIFK